MTTITVGVRVAVADDATEATKASLVQAAKDVLEGAKLGGSILTTTVSTDPETGEKVKKSKMSYVSESYTEDDEDEAAPGFFKSLLS